MKFFAIFGLAVAIFVLALGLGLVFAFPGDVAD